MKMEKWETAGFVHVALKLSEEVGEVAKEVNDSYMKSPQGREVCYERALTELDHVISLATMLKARLTTELKSARLR